MAQYHLFSVLVHTPPSSSDLIANDVVDMFWDDSTSAIVVKKNNVVWTGSAGGYFGDLNTNYYLSRATSFEGEYAVSSYSYCSGADLKWFRMVLSFAAYPYAEQQTTVNSPVCATGGGVVCDITFSGAPTITHATDLTTGGSITVTATSSNGVVRYGLRNSEYSAMTNTSGTFTGIPPGNWTVYAKDANDCTAILNFKILFKPTEAEHYRFSWISVATGQGEEYDARVRIYEREYVGDLVEIDRGEESPFRLLKPKSAGHINDKMYPIHPTSAVLSLYSQKDYQFLPLFTQDNKKYRVVYEVDEGSGYSEVWQGFIIPAVYRENFVSVPYSVEVEIVDNLKRLEQETFTDDEGNLLHGSMKLIKVISLILKKTGLSLKIRSGINIFETNHTKAATDDPLDQTYIDVACYREGAEPFDCWRVLESILRPFGARIYQCDNQWQIEEIDRATATYAYRVFTADGVYESNSTFNPIVDVKASSYTDRAAMMDEDHSLEVIPAYGKIDITSKLNYIGSIVAGGFEKEDLLSPESETFSVGQGIFRSEEGFRGWTLRLNGTSGVSFGRVVIGRRGDSSRTGLTGEDDLSRSVGAFYYDANSWSGNLRNAYIESDEKPYQYGPGDELNLHFQYSTPAKPEYPFMVLRMVIKLGSNYLQNDLSWAANENVFRAYPPVTNSLQTFELGVSLPTTSVLVDTTVQVRIYFYASEFYDYGLPPNSNNPADGTDGIADLKSMATLNVDYDYNVDFRIHETVGSVTNYLRAFAELAYSTAAEDIPNGIIRPNDFNATTNPKIFRSVGKSVLENNPSGASLRRGIDRKFYIDNVALDPLINGQPPPTEDIISLNISKYINESLEVELYNFDLPDITNGKNMYNNYFRLSSGTPTALWARSGISESLTLQQILLRVLGANHSAPTFRLTGSFVNEFSRIGINNYIRITKPGSRLSATNTEFTSDLSGWSQSSLPLTGTWAWTASNSGSAAVTMSGSDDSKKIYQEIYHSGGYIEISVTLKAIPTLSSNDAEDVLWVLMYNGSQIVHAEKMVSFPAITSTSDYDFKYTAFAPGEITRLGFFIKRVTGTGEVTYQVSKFSPAGTDIQEVYQIADYASEERFNTYTFELMQQSKSYISLGAIDTGGNNQSGGSTGREHSSAYSSAYS